MIKVYIMESEKGWGLRTDEIMSFPCRKEAEAFVKEFNRLSIKEGPVPDWYMYAEICE